MKRKWIGRAVLAAVVSVSACLPKVDQPEVWLDGARLSSLGISGGVVDVHLSVYNPNTFELRASGLTYDLDLEEASGDGWVDFTEGTLDRDLRVQPRDTVDVVVPVEFTYRTLGQAVRSLLERGEFDYRVSGSVALEGPVSRAIRYRHTGTVTPDGVR